MLADYNRLLLTQKIHKGAPLHPNQETVIT